MKCRPEDMLLFDLDYGDLIRPPFRILRGRGWGQCTNQTEEHLIVYGPKQDNERSIFDTSPYVLPPGATTPDSWDCEGFLLPSDKMLRRWRGHRRGPLAIKFWNYRHFWVKKVGAKPTGALGTTAFSSRARSTGPFRTFRIRTSWAALESLAVRPRDRPSDIPPQWRDDRGSPSVIQGRHGTPAPAYGAWQVYQHPYLISRIQIAATA